MDDRALHGALLGSSGSRHLMNTPVLVLEIDALDRNIAAMQQLADRAGVALRPHAKTHKCVEIARRQMAAGAVGQCCAKIGEAEVLSEGGICGLLITSPVAAPQAVRRLAALASRAPDLRAVVDDPEIVAHIDTALGEAGAKMEVLIDIDPGMHRTGVATPEAAVELAGAIASSQNLRLAGVQFYCGTAQHIESFAERREDIVKRTDYLRTVVKMLRAAGHEIATISGSGTGTHRIDIDLGMFTELQVGSYIFMDGQYVDCDLTGDGKLAFETSLFVDTRVVSANQPGMVTIDAGFKSLSTDGGLPTVVSGADRGTRFAFLGDEHGALISEGISRELRPGSLVTLAVPHCDPTVNLYDTYHVVRDETLVDMWPVSARGRVR